MTLGLSLSPFTDSAVRQVAESDIAELVHLFELNYGKDYIDPEVYSGNWFKRCIHNDSLVCLVLEQAGQVLASGAVVLDFGDYNDQIGEIARLVVHPQYTGQGLGKRIIQALFEAADHSVECALGYARTANAFSQKMFERAAFTPIGFLPQYYAVKQQRESIVLYAKLLGNSASLRCQEPPTLIQAVAPLAQQVLTQMGLLPQFTLVDPAPYPSQSDYAIQPVDRQSLDALVRIEQGRVVEPLLFGSLSIDQGLSFIRRRKADYWMAVDADQQPVGAIGFQFDATSQIVKGIELIAKEEGVRGVLCQALVAIAEQQLQAKVIEINLSAYDARLQQTFCDQGFHPVAYAPAMVFHGTQRLDVVKMLKLNFSVNSHYSDTVKLTKLAQEIVVLPENIFHL